MPPKITVLIPTFNRSVFLTECLESVLTQTLAPTQIIVVNDGSTDNTLDILKPYRDRIDYIEINQSGKSIAINTGLEKVLGNYLWIFDDDDVALPDALERFVQPLLTQPQCGFSYGTYYTTETSQDNDHIGEVLWASQIPDFQRKGFLLSLLERNFLSGAALFARTSCYRELGGYDPGLAGLVNLNIVYPISIRF